MASNLGFVHDSNARNDERMVMLRAQLGWEGIGIYWGIVECLREASETKLTKAKANGLALVLSVEFSLLQKVLNCCFEEGLFLQDEKYFWSNRLTRNAAEYEAKIARLKENGQKGGRPKTNQEPSPKPIALEDESKSSKERNRIEEKGKEKNREEQNRKEEIPEPSPAEIDAYELATASLVGQITKPKPLPPSTHPSPQVSWAKYMPEAEGALESPADQTWTRSNLYIGAGKRPMKKYPSIMLKEAELAQIIELYEQKIPSCEWKRVFQIAESNINHQAGKGKSVDWSNPFVPLTTWALEGVLKCIRQENALKEQAERRAS